MPEFIDTCFTHFPTTPRCVTPTASLVWAAVEIVGESKPPWLLAIPIWEEPIIDGCECLARLASSDKIPKYPLTQFSNSSSDYLTLKIKTLLRGQGM